LGEGGMTGEKTPRGDGSVGRTLDILDLFSLDRPLIRAEDVMDHFGYTKSTAYRYLKILADTGLIAQSGKSQYGLGPRIIELEMLMIQADPLMQAGQVEIPLVAQTNPNSAIILSSLYRDRVLCIHKEGPDVIRTAGQVLQLRRKRGNHLPLFYGAASLIILAMLPTHRIKGLYLERHEELQQDGVAPDWKSFRKRMSIVRRDGHLVTIEQYREHLAAVAVPIIPQDGGDVRASLTRIMAAAEIPAEGPGRLIDELKEAASRIAAKI
jgi:DNA-binding IclR family transcriptional regulator